MSACAGSPGQDELLDEAIEFAESVHGSNDAAEILVDPRPGQGPGYVEVPAGGDWVASVYCLTDGDVSLQFDGEVATERECESGTMFGVSGSSADGPVEVGVAADDDQYWMVTVTVTEIG